jgi:phospholipid/cholesterol/gamma-HCH transport system ATP-binding protein
MSKPAAPPILQAQNLRKITLQSLNLEIRGAENVAIIGPSGSGKSILLRCLLGLMTLDSGSVQILDHSVDGRPVTLSGVGVAFQEPGLFDGLTVAENLQLASEAELPNRRFRDLLSEVGLEQVNLDASSTVLSGGQQKRVALARAFLHGNELLVLDEPTSGLDPGSIREVVSLLQEKTRTRSLLLITHDYEVALALSDRVLLLDEGRLREVTPEAKTEEQAVEHLETALRTAEAPDVDSEPAPSSSRGWGVWAALRSFLWRSVPLTAAIMAVLGVLLVVQTAGLGFIDISRYVPEAVVNSVFRELAPLVIGLLLAGRLGAEMASEVAGMRYSAQLDSMHVLGISPVKKLLIPNMIASAITFPINVLLGAFLAAAGGAWIAQFPWSGLSIGVTRFRYLAQEALTPLLVGAAALKGICMGVGVALVCYGIGSRAVRSAAQLGTAVTQAVFAGSVTVILIDFLFSWLFFS